MYKMDNNSGFNLIEDRECDNRIDDTPRNTKRSNTWCNNLWNDWAKARNDRQTNSSFPYIPKLEDITRLITEKQFIFFMKRFVFEVRNKTGEPYTPETLKILSAGIQRHLRESGWPTLSILDNSKKEYKEVHDALTARCQELYSAGIGTSRKQADNITREHETILWDKGILNSETSKGLSKCVFFYTSKVFGLRLADEHRNLKLSQFTFGSDQFGKYVQFHGRLNKTIKGGMTGKPEHFKFIKHYQNVNNPRTYYNIIEKYVTSIPKENKKDIFYFRPLNGMVFSHHIIGKNTLDGYVSTMMNEANIEGYFTNRSIKATLAGDMYQKGYDEQLIMEKTGHTSTSISAELDPPAPPKSNPFPYRVS